MRNSFGNKTRHVFNFTCTQMLRKKGYLVSTIIIGLLIFAGIMVVVLVGANKDKESEAPTKVGKLIVCNHSITFGPHVQTSWCCTLMDTDQHALFGPDGNRCNPDRPIVFADHVWLGCHVVVTKGTSLPSHTTVGAMSCLHGTFDEAHTILAGNPAKVVRRGITRQW